MRCMPGGGGAASLVFDHGTEQIEILQYPAVCNACPLRYRCPAGDLSGSKIVTISSLTESFPIHHGRP